MNIKYSPQRNDDRIQYEITGDKITATYEVLDTTELYKDTFDFTNMSDGVLENVETVLPINPILFAKGEKGVLYIELLHFIGADATEEERFPDWMEV